MIHTKARMCDECGLPDKGEDGSYAPWPHQSPGHARATQEEKEHGIPYHFPAAHYDTEGGTFEHNWQEHQ